MKKIKKMLASLMVVVMMLTAAPLSGFVGMELPESIKSFFSTMAEAASVTTGSESNLQEYGEFRWNYYKESKTFVITGEGALRDYNTTGTTFYQQFGYDFSHDDVKHVVISNGITKIGKRYFYYWDNVEDIAIPKSVTQINRDVFESAPSLSNIYYEGSQQDWERINIDSENAVLLNAKVHFEFDVLNKLSNNYNFDIPVKAIVDNKTGEKINVEGAEVTVYLGTDGPIASEKTDSNGVAHFNKDSFNGVSCDMEYILSVATVSAHKDIGGGLTLCSEEVKADGTWIGSSINIAKSKGLLVDEPRWYISDVTVACKEKYFGELEMRMAEFAKKFAQVTNGHIIIDKFNYMICKNNSAIEKSDADIKIIDDSGLWHKNIVANTQGMNLDYSKYCTPYQAKRLSNHKAYISIGWSDDHFVETLCHEAGHFFVYLYDEYYYGGGCEYDVNGDGRISGSETFAGRWEVLEGGVTGGKIPRPPGAPKNFGLMEVQWADSNAIELSTQESYKYLEDSNLTKVDKNRPEMYTKHYYEFGFSCETMLYGVLNRLAEEKGYCTNYSFCEQGILQSVEYDFCLPQESYFTASSYTGLSETESVIYNTAENAIQTIGEVDFAYDGEKFDIKYEGDEVLAFIEDVELNMVYRIDLCDNESVRLYLNSGAKYILTIIRNHDNKYEKNEYYFNKVDIDKTYEDGVFSLYSKELINAVIVYYSLSNQDGAYESHSMVYQIVLPRETTLEGSILSAVSEKSEVNFESLSWFEEKNKAWEKIESYQYVEEHGMLGVGADFCVTEGAKFVLMSKEVGLTEYSAPFGLNIDYEKCIYDGQVRVSFDDTNSDEDIYGYIVYYSEDYASVSILSDNTTRKHIKSKECYISDLKCSNTKYYFCVVAVGFDGARSMASEIVSFEVKPKDSNDDGLSDSWVSKYGFTDDNKLSERDTDEDGLTNLEEYKFGTNPLNADSDGDNVYDGIEIRNTLDPLNPKTDGKIDDYIVIYSTPDVCIDETMFTFDESTITCTISNKSEGKAMRTNISLYDPSGVLLETAVVNLDALSSIEYTFPKEYLVEGFKIIIDENKITRDTDYNNNEFVYVPAEGIVAKSNETIVTKGESVGLAYELIPENASKLISISISDSTKISVDKYGTMTGKAIGKCTVAIVTASGHECSMEVVVEPIPGAGFTDFDCRIINDDQVEIIGYIGDDSHVNVPCTIAGMSVVNIGDDTFANSNMSTLILPGTLKLIGKESFYNCVNLESVTMSDSIISIGDYAFANCVNLTSITISENVIIEDGVMNISNSAFEGYTSLASVTIPDSVTSIGEYTFYGCTAMNNLVLGDGVTTIGIYAFGSCTGLTEVSFGNGISVINKDAFYGCSKIKTVNYNGTEEQWNKVTIGANNTPIINATKNFKAPEHTCEFGEWVVTVSPTATQSGMKTHTCSICGATETADLPSLSIETAEQVTISFNTGIISGFDSGLSSLDSYIMVDSDVYTWSYESNNGKFGTGSKAILKDGNTVIGEYTILVYGDTTGDSWYDGQDAIIVDCLVNGMLTKDDVGEAVYAAADCNHDGVIDQLDVALLNEAGTLLANVDQSKSAEVLLETSSEYVEYLDLIDQSPEIEIEDETDAPEADVDMEATTPEQDAELNIFEIIISFIKSIFEMFFAYIPMPLK